MRGIALAGGEWLAIEFNGAFRRNMGSLKDEDYPHAASMCRHLKYSSIIRMRMMSTNLWQLSAISVDILMLGKSA